METIEKIYREGSGNHWALIMKFKAVTGPALIAHPHIYAALPREHYKSIYDRYNDDLCRLPGNDYEINQSIVDFKSKPPKSYEELKQENAVISYADHILLESPDSNIYTLFTGGINHEISESDFFTLMLCPRRDRQKGSS